MKNLIKKEPSLQNKKAVNIANKMGKRYTLLDAMLMGKKLKIDWKKSKFTMGDLLVGMHYELEHGKVDSETNVTNDNALKTAKIAWAHLKERPDYYVQLMKIDPPKKMEKVAAPKWREMWGSLSEESQKKLQAPGQIASREIETAKRMSGIDNISKKFGVKRYSDQMPRIPLPSKNHPKLRSFIEGVNKGIDEEGHKTGPHNFKFGKLHYVFNPMESKNDKWLKSKTAERFGRRGGENLLQLKYRNKPLYDEITSIVSAHEMLGEAMAHNNKKQLTGFSGKILYSKHNPIGVYQSHESPSVLHRESAIVATASPEAKNFMKNLRSVPFNPAEKSLTAKVYKNKGLAPGKMTEIKELKDIGGIEYGKDAIINKAKEKAHRMAYRNEIDPLLRRGRK